VRDGDTVALEGFTHLIPFAAGHEIIRQGRRDLALVRMTPDLIYDQMIGMGCARSLTFSWGGNPGVGSLHRFRDAVENGWPNPLVIDERSHADVANAYVAGAANLPFAILRSYAGCDLPRYNERIRSITCPFTGERLAATPAIRPDVTVIHAQRADRRGNVLLWGIIGVQKEAALAAKRVIVTVEEIVDSLDAPPNAVRAAELDAVGSLRSAARRVAVVCTWLLRPQQFFLQGMGRHRARSLDLHRVDEAACPIQLTTS
jgi:glutaconate CoA-transferase subunit A